MATQDNTGLTIALVGGGALLLWLLWRRRGTGKDGDGDRSSARPNVEVRLRAGDRIELNGVRTDLATVIARARGAGTAVVKTDGDARQGWHREVTDALKAAGATVFADP